HRYRVNAVAWSRDGKRLASGDESGTVKIWGPTTGKELLEIKTNSRSTPHGLSWGPDGSRLVTPQGPRTWDTTTGKPLIPGGLGVYVLSASWGPDGKRLAAGTEQGQVKVLDAATARTMVTFTGHSDAVQCVAWSADGKRLASASSDGTVKIWGPEQNDEP